MIICMYIHKFVYTACLISQIIKTLYNFLTKFLSVKALYCSSLKLTYNVHMHIHTQS